MDYIILCHHQQLYLDELTTSTHQDGTCTAQKTPKQWFIYRCLGLRYACYEYHITTTATNHHNWWQMGARDGSRALMYVFFLFYFFYFYTNMNFLLNRHYHQQDNTNVSTMSTHQDSTLEHRKRPKWWYILSFGL